MTVLVPYPVRSDDGYLVALQSMRVDLPEIRYLCRMEKIIAGSTKDLLRCPADDIKDGL